MTRAPGGRAAEEWAMATAKIHIVGPNEYDLLRDLYNEVARPAVNGDFFRRRLDGRRNALAMVADVDERPVGFTCGYELRSTTYYSWLYGVIPDARRLGVASQLMDAVHAWVAERGYEMLRFECYNQHRPMILAAIRNGYDIVGIRWDSHTAGNLVIFERVLQSVAP